MILVAPQRDKIFYPYGCLDKRGLGAALELQDAWPVVQFYTEKSRFVLDAKQTSDLW